MPYTPTAKNVVLTALAVALVLCGGRWVKSHFHTSYFICAGSDFVDSTKTLAPVVVQPGQGYDGQFFYRYALAPLNFQQHVFGVNVDHPPYRVQRIGYPVLAWLVSFGGIPVLVPWAMILVNILAFAGVFYYTTRYVTAVGGYMNQAWLPLALCGLYMSMGRDLSEVVELFFLVGTIYYLFRSQYLLCGIFATCTVLTRDTSMIALLPLLAGGFLKGFRAGERARLLWLSLPFVLFAAWKVYIYYHMPSLTDTTIGYTSIGLPFVGIWDGLKANSDLTTTKNIMQFLFWVGYLIWNTWFVGILFSSFRSSEKLKLDNIGILTIAYCSWMLFALCFSLNIYTDDWGYVRIFSQWNMLGILILIAHKKQTARLFNYFSATLAVLTIVRLIARV